MKRVKILPSSLLMLVFSSETRVDVVCVTSFIGVCMLVVLVCRGTGIDKQPLWRDAIGWPYFNCWKSVWTAQGFTAPHTAACVAAGGGKIGWKSGGKGWRRGWRRGVMGVIVTKTRSWIYKCQSLSLRISMWLLSFAPFKNWLPLLLVTHPTTLTVQ